MTTNVVRVPGNYIIQASPTITLDPSGGLGLNTGTVVITGSLSVLGKTTTVASTNAEIKDNVLILNSGETNSYVTLGTSGLIVDRGNGANLSNAATMLFNDSAGLDGFTWHTSDISGRGIFEFKAAGGVSAIRINAIRIDENSAPRVGGYPRLNIFGSDNSGAVISVAGTANYETRVIDKDDIPNKAYVDIQIAANQSSVDNIRKIKQGPAGSETYVQLNDISVTGQPSNIELGINQLPVATISQGSVIFPGLAFTNQTITALSGSGTADLYLEPTGSGSVILRKALRITNQNLPPISNTNTTAIYTTGIVGPGGTGIYYLNSLASGEFISRKRAIIYGLIF
jgi:hypothetical protein